MAEAAITKISQTRIPSISTIASSNISLSDEEVVRRVLAGETALFEVIMRRYNQRLYRAARSITRNDSQAEDIMQAAYVRAYEHLHQFAGRAPFGAWITRIAVNEALGRLRETRRYAEVDAIGDFSDSAGFETKGDRMDRFASPAPDPEQAAASSEASRLLETLIEALPGGNRSVFVLRDVEGMTTAEVSHTLGITEENVKVRLHRARAALRNGLAAYASRETRHVFAFHAIRCDRIVRNVLERILTAAN